MHPKAIHVRKCNQCQETFTENFELENNIKTHNETETCDKYGKDLILRWRLRIHRSVYKTDKYCLYFNNGKYCPFNPIWYGSLTFMSLNITFCNYGCPDAPNPFSEGWC